MKRLVGLLVCLLALAATPQAALGQSAGDEQYADPFGQEQPQSAPDPPPNDGSQGTGQTAPGAEPAPSQAPPAQTAAPETAAPQTAAPQTNTNSSAALAYTGVPAGLIALLGAVALAAGLVLRAIAGPPPAARHR